MIISRDGVHRHLQVAVQVAAEVLGMGSNRAASIGFGRPRYIVIGRKQVPKRVRKLQSALVARVHVGEEVCVIRVRDGVCGQHHRDEDRGWW